MPQRSECVCVRMSSALVSANTRPLTRPPLPVQMYVPSSSPLRFRHVPSLSIQCTVCAKHVHNRWERSVSLLARTSQCGHVTTSATPTHLLPRDPCTGRHPLSVFFPASSASQLTRSGEYAVRAPRVLLMLQRVWPWSCAGVCV